MLFRSEEPEVTHVHLNVRGLASIHRLSNRATATKTLDNILCVYMHKTILKYLYVFDPPSVHLRVSICVCKSVFVCLCLCVCVFKCVCIIVCVSVRVSV